MIPEAFHSFHQMADVRDLLSFRIAYRWLGVGRHAITESSSFVWIATYQSHHQQQ